MVMPMRLSRILENKRGFRSSRSEQNKLVAKETVIMIVSFLIRLPLL
jgi:hypothetical protein